MVNAVHRLHGMKVHISARKETTNKKVRTEICAYLCGYVDYGAEISENGSHEWLAWRR